ncbi:MAG: glycosyltransferase family protein [Rhodospirillales bacterium]|jgi:spore coat polysaccharide biosynthesis protein SpsF|nr:glycosyltransferase family protein [Rhodospirillales bacterium]
MVDTGRVVAVVPVRMGSSRLPGKVMMNVNGVPLLGYIMDRLALSSKIDEVVVATSVAAKNDVIQSYCADRNTPCYRGSEDDVLDRLVQALKQNNAAIGVLVFGDCPLIDPEIVDFLVEQYLVNPGHDFVSNDLKTTYPPGMEVEVFSINALEDAATTCDDPTIREHGTLFIRQNPERYSLLNIEAPEELSRPELELEVDAAEDLFVVEGILEHFKGRTDFHLSEIIHFMDTNSELAKSNQSIPRRWKEFRQ